MPTTTKRAKPTRPLACHVCGAGPTILHIPGAGNRRTVRGRKRQATYVRCTSCGNEWFSTHPEALKLGREADRAAKAGRA